MAVPLLAIVVTAIVVGSFMPLPAKEFLGTELRSVRIPGTALHFNLHRTLHVAVFAVMSWLLFSIPLPDAGRLRTAARLGLMALMAAVLAFTIEVVEMRFARIHLEWPDVKDDLTGIAIALAITLLARARSGSANPAASEK